MWHSENEISRLTFVRIDRWIRWEALTQYLSSLFTVSQQQRCLFRGGENFISDSPNSFLRGETKVYSLGFSWNNLGRLLDHSGKYWNRSRSRRGRSLWGHGNLGDDWLLISIGSEPSKFAGVSLVDDSETLVVKIWWEICRRCKQVELNWHQQGKYFFINKGNRVNNRLSPSRESKKNWWQSITDLSVLSCRE